jgi:hypothetical protein
MYGVDWPTRRLVCESDAGSGVARDASFYSLSIQSIGDGLSMIAHLDGILKTGRQVGCRR